MVEEVRDFFDYLDFNYLRGIKKVIGVLEFDMFFRNELFLNMGDREELLSKVVDEIKRNIFGLVCK